QLLAEEDGGVRGDDPAVAVLRCDRRRLLPREPRHVLLGRLPVRAHLGDGAGDDVELEADGREQLAPARRGGSQNELHVGGVALPMLSTTTNRASGAIR